MYSYVCPWIAPYAVYFQSKATGPVILYTRAGICDHFFPLSRGGGGDMNGCF